MTDFHIDYDQSGRGSCRVKKYVYQSGKSEVQGRDHEELYITGLYDMKQEKGKQNSKYDDRRTQYTGQVKGLSGYTAD